MGVWYRVVAWDDLDRAAYRARPLEWAPRLYRAGGRVRVWVYRCYLPGSAGSDIEALQQARVAMSGLGPRGKVAG